MGIHLNILIASYVTLAGCGETAPTRSGDRSSQETGGSGNRPRRPTSDNGKTTRPNLQELNDQTDAGNANSQKRKNLSPESVTLADIKPLIDKHCIRCHGASGNRSDLTKDAEVLLRGADIVRRTASKTNGMPSDNPRAVTQEEKNLLMNWKASGYAK